jgi:hypothetical protein
VLTLTMCATQIFEENDRQRMDLDLLMDTLRQQYPFVAVVAW